MVRRAQWYKSRKGPLPRRSRISTRCATSTARSSLRHEQGLINEFALIYNLRDSFPLHFVVFKQTAVHIPHEANVEQVFSTSGILSSAHTDPHHLARLTMIARNMSVYKPPVAKLLPRYYQKFSKAGQLEWEQSNLGLEAQECDVCDE